MKKAQGISINTVVIAAIALVVMILIVMIFTGSLGNWRKSENSCETNGGRCVSRSAWIAGDVCSGDYDRVRNDYPCYSGGDIDNTAVCCIST